MATESTFAWLAGELEKKLKLLDDKNKELMRIDGVHDTIREENRVRKEFVDVISDIIRDIAMPKVLDMKKRIRVPILKGEQGENLETYILRTVAWFQELKIGTDGDKVKKFKLTLDGNARQWLDDVTPPTTLDDLSAQFKKIFSTQGRSIRHLHEK